MMTMMMLMMLTTTMTTTAMLMLLLLMMTAGTATTAIMMITAKSKIEIMRVIRHGNGGISKGLKVGVRGPRKAHGGIQVQSPGGVRG